MYIWRPRLLPEFDRCLGVMDLPVLPDLPGVLELEFVLDLPGVVASMTGPPSS